ncbi:hypothetical protein Bca4012_066152 [Brassica carinata]
MTSLLMRTGSLPVQTRFIPSRKVTTTISRHNSVESLPSHDGGRFSAGKISIDGMRRVSSESVASKPSPAKIPEEDDEFRFSEGWGSLIWKESGNPAEEQGVSGGGGGSGYSGGKGEGGGGYDDRSKIGDYYREMLKSDPSNSLLLMNYGKFLYEVEKDAERAEEYYGRAILENPGDGEALSMYGKLIWETKRDEKRARGYFDQAVIASPDDCSMVMGSYAHFMWEAEDEDGDEEIDLMAASPALVSAV